MWRWSVQGAESSYLHISSTTIWIQALANSAAIRQERIKWTEAKILLTSCRSQMKVLSQGLQTQPAWLSALREAFSIISTGRSKQAIHVSWTNTSSSCSWVMTRLWMKSTSQITKPRLNYWNLSKRITTTLEILTQRGQWIRKLTSLKRNSGRQMNFSESLPLRSKVWEKREKS